MRADCTLESILQCPSLPSLPTVAMQVLELTRQQNVRFKEIERVVQHDPALAAKILKTVNSSFYGLSEPCPTIGRAIAYLGLNTVKSLVLGFSLVDLTRREEGGVDLLAYWRRCICAAASARRTALRLDTCDPEEAFIGALMQDIGMLAMDAALGEDYGAVVSRAEGDHERLPDIERDVFGFDHAEVGARLGVAWRLPPQLIDPIRHHHDACLLPDSAGEMTRIVAFSYELQKALDPAAGAGSAPVIAGAALLDLTADDVRALVDATIPDTRELSGLFKVRIGALPDASAVLAEAEDARLALQVRMHRESEALARAAETDALTGIGNRKRFDETLARAHGDALADGGRLGLILVDADKFKSFNDTYGHQAGDAVLKEIARRLDALVGHAGIVCRYGGEEFGVVLPGADRAATARVAEGLRRVIEASPMTIDDEQAVPVTASFGAAAVEPSTAALFTTPRRLIEAADRGLYAAKHAGRNCVRVFRPRTTPAAA